MRKPMILKDVIQDDMRLWNDEQISNHLAYSPLKCCCNLNAFNIYCVFIECSVDPNQICIWFWQHRFTVRSTWLCCSISSIGEFTIRTTSPLGGAAVGSAIETSVASVSTRKSSIVVRSVCSRGASTRAISTLVWRLRVSSTIAVLLSIVWETSVIWTFRITGIVARSAYSRRASTRAISTLGRQSGVFPSAAALASIAWKTSVIWRLRIFGTEARLTPSHWALTRSAASVWESSVANPSDCPA